MSHILSSSVENGDLAGTGIGNNVGPDLTLAIQENLKYGVGFSGLGRELLSRDNRAHPAAATSSLAGVSEGIRGSGSSSISINNNNNTSNNGNTNTTTTTTTNNNNGLYENGSSSDGIVLLPATTGDTRSNITNMTPSLYVAFTNPSTTSGSSISSSTVTTGSVTTINSYNNNNYNGTAAHPTTDLNTNNSSITNNTTSLDSIINTSGGCSDPVTSKTNSNNNTHNNIPIFSINNTGGTAITLPLSTSDHYPKQCQVTDSTHENKLNELFLLHIDFIHHQQDLLVQKDREINDLKSENETLKCRLDRMERRLSILKQKGEPVNSHHHHHHHHHHHTPKSQASNDGLTGDRGNKKFNFLKRRERKFGVDAQNVQKKKGSETTKSKTQSLMKNKLSYRSSDSVNRCQELSENGDVILRTDNLYYVSYYEPPLPSEKLLVNIRHTNDEINPDGSKVEIPHWRLRPVANCYTLEGTENLEDEVFTKRHQKPELEEKRRKRWDLQRMREQKLFERLRERGKPYPDSMKDEPQLITSFYPSLDDITHIEIADKVPVTAFGHPIPYIKPADFELPWEQDEWPSTSSSSGEDNRHQKHRRVKRK